MDDLHWDATYAIALALKKNHPLVELESVSLNMIFHWTIALEAFKDDPSLANEGILLAIYQNWYEEIINGQE